MRSIPALLLVFCATSPSFSADGQPPREPSGQVFETVEVNVVDLEVWVTDKQGNPVGDLGKEDFELTVGGEKVEISNFYVQTAAAGSQVPATEGRGTSVESTMETLEVPEARSLRLVVFVDNNHIEVSNRKQVFRSLRTFLSENLAPGDSVMVAGLSPSLKIYSEFTDDLETVGALLDEIEKSAVVGAPNRFERQRILSELSRSQNRTTRGDARTPVISARNYLVSIRAYAAEEYQRGKVSLETLTAFAQTLAGVPGRKALLLVSDGIPTNPGEEIFVALRDAFYGADAMAGTGIDATGSPDTIDFTYTAKVGSFDLFPQTRELGRQANSARVTIYPIDGEGDGPDRIRGAGLEGNISSEAFSVAEANYRDPMELAALRTGGKRYVAKPRLDEELDDLGRAFRAFYSLGFTLEEIPDKPLPVTVTVARKGLRVRHRQDVLPRSADAQSADATYAALLYDVTSNPLNVELIRQEVAQGQDGKRVLSLELSIPIGGLEMVPVDGKWIAQLSLFLTVKGRRGSVRPVQKVPFRLAIPDAQIDQARASSARYPVPVVLEDGDEQVGITVRDDLGNLRTALRLDLEALTAAALP